MQLIVYTEQSSSRLEYIFSTLLRAIGISDFIVTTDQSSYTEHKGARLNYSSLSIYEGEVQIAPVNLLFEKDIKPQHIRFFLWKDLPAFFKTNGTDVPFDLFAASFYLLTRYEEYLPYSQDVYGRYAHENSIAFKNNFLQIPLVNLWLKEFVQILQRYFPTLSLQPSAFSFLPTYDIDIAWSYLNKGWQRNAGGFIRSIVNGQWSMIKERINVLSGKRPDPFDSYNWLNMLHAQTDLHPLYFFLVARQNKGYDKNILPSKAYYQHLIRKVAAKYKIGIHPSWQSGDDSSLITQEVTTLNTITGNSVNKSRQHYIRMKLPGTYCDLIAAGITEEYSMGYGSINGFRASYCLPYNCYNLEKEVMTPLIIYPFCYMDANSFYEQKYSLTQACKELEHYYEVTKNVNGLLITIWHNHFLGTDKMFTGWKEMYEDFINKHFLKSS